MTDQDVFEEILPQKKSTPALADVVVSVIGLRGGQLRVSFNFSEPILRQISGEGWPRFSIEFSKATRRFRITSKVQGPHEVRDTIKGNRFLLRCPPPPGVELREWDRVDADFVVNGQALYVTLPLVMLKPPKVDHAGENAKAAAAVKTAAVKVPAPKF